MKKLIAYLLLCIVLFNTAGYLAIHEYLEHKTQQFFVDQTAKGFYNVKDLTEITIPLNMPYIHDWTRFERVSGQVQFQNINYNFVKMRLTRTAVHLMCVPNYDTTKPTDKNILDARNMKGSSVPQKDHVPYPKSAVVETFSYFTFAQFVFTCPVIKSFHKNIVHTVQPLVNYYQDIPEQPPKASC
ncbi:hypothetical protein [Mucilaginibacter celer]|uniref:Uncharacterized protein n=1 Tax=Mucilaginibacter celer TaxID=2305508 RepID=A0A494W271_9SPHI|nr:hypothetical protein [Mucilaginibacter celer]AYL97615.1 hypothetical protein HYN43_020985 [Mucilaginibacter celer]